MDSLYAPKQKVCPKAEGSISPARNISVYSLVLAAAYPISENGEIAAAPMVQEDTSHAQSCMITDLYAHSNNEERR